MFSESELKELEENGLEEDPSVPGYEMTRRRQVRELIASVREARELLRWLIRVEEVNPHFRRKHVTADGEEAVRRILGDEA